MRKGNPKADERYLEIRAAFSELGSANITHSLLKIVKNAKVSPFSKVLLNLCYFKKRGGESYD